MEKNYTINQSIKQSLERIYSKKLNNPNLTMNQAKIKYIKKDFLITSITPEITTRNKILEVEENDFDEKIFILKISGNINFSNISWNIYISPTQIKNLFEEMEKDLMETDKESINPIMSEYFKVVKNYSIDSIYGNIDKIINFIQYFYNDTKARDLPIFKEALKISDISFSNNNGIKPFEGYAYKKAEPRYLRYVIKTLFSPIEHAIFKQRNKRWIVLKDDMICYLNDPNNMIGKNVYWFDETSEIYKIKQRKLEIDNLSISLNLKFETKFERDLWYKEINERIEIKRNEIMNNAYHSFASQKNNCRAKWFIDGANYFNYLLEQLKQARETVHITDWFLSPPVALKRPIDYNQFIGEKNDYLNLIKKGNLNILRFLNKIKLFIIC